jgi:hypothetical protein
VFVVVVATVGVYTVDGAVGAGLAYVVLNVALSGNLTLRWSNLLEVIFGLGAVVYALHPEGAVEYVKRLTLERFTRRGIETEVLA